MLQQIIVHVALLTAPVLPARPMLRALADHDHRFYNLVVNDDVWQYYDRRIGDTIVDAGRFWIGLPPKY